MSQLESPSVEDLYIASAGIRNAFYGLAVPVVSAICSHFRTFLHLILVLLVSVAYLVIGTHL